MIPNTEPERLRAALQQLSEAFDMKVAGKTDVLSCFASLSVSSSRHTKTTVHLSLSWFSPHFIGGKLNKDFNADDFYEAIVMASAWIDGMETDRQRKARESNQLAAVLGLNVDGSLPRCPDCHGLRNGDEQDRTTWEQCTSQPCPAKAML